MELEAPDFGNYEEDCNSSIKIFNQFPLLELVDDQSSTFYESSGDFQCSDSSNSYEEQATFAKTIPQRQYKISKCNKYENENEKQSKNMLIIGNTNLNSCKAIKLFAGISITNDGVARFCYSLSQISFGFQQQLISRIEHKHRIGLTNIHLYLDETLPVVPLQQGLSFMRQFYNPLYPQVEQRLQYYNNKITMLRNQIKSISLTDLQVQKKEEEFQEFIELSLEYIEDYALQNPHQMYQYTLGRVNLIQGDTEIVRAGYSRPYLQLLGLHPDSFSAIALRQQKIELLRNKSDIQSQSLQGLKTLNMHNKRSEQMEEKFESEIVTFDGFPIRLYQEKRNIHIPLKQERTKQLNLDFPYILCITQIDVELNDLQNLIAYRKKIALNPKFLTLDEYLTKELSLQFENVEYSVHSQAFVEKYYSEIIQDLQAQSENLQKKNYACYKFISHPNKI